MKEEELARTVVWRHRDVDKTLVLMKEWGVDLDSEVMKEKGISICQLLYFKVKDFK